ncbi:MAG: anaerobic selenocysteine-containing dehydrogenase [Bradymonadia bacterium]|jgi:anaerobic selenocysteine-containing dehydrogenase
MIHKRTCNICEALCGVIIEHDGEEITGIRGNPDDVFSRGHICPKAVALQDLHNDPDRLRQPVRKVGDKWEPISWEDAIEEVATRVFEIQERHGPNAVAVYAGNPNAHNYSTLLGNLPFQQVLRTRSRFSATSVDQLPHMFAALQMFGHQLMLPVPDIRRTSHMVILGANPAVSNGSLMTAPGAPKELKRIRERGGKVVVIDPRRTRTAELADEHLFVRPGTDALLLSSIVHTLFDEDLTTGGHWETYSRGTDNLKLFVAGFSPERVASIVGIGAAEIRRITREFAAAPTAVFYSRIGVCTQEFGGVNAWLTIAINMLTDNLDRAGGMMFPNPAVDLAGVAAKAGQAGHFGIWKSRVSGYPEFGGELPVAALAEEIETPGEGQIRALLCMAGNPVLSTPEGERLGKAIDSLEFVVALDMYITATSSRADIIIPPLSPLERDHYGLAFHGLSVHNTAKYSEKLFEPPAGAHDDWETLTALAKRLNQLKNRGVSKWKTNLTLSAVQSQGPSKALDLLLRTGPYGMIKLSGPRLSLAKLKANKDGVDLGPLRSVFPDRIYHSDGIVDIAPPILMSDYPRLEAFCEAQLKAEPGLQLIGRRQLRSNNTWLHNSARLVKGPPSCTLLMNPADAEDRSLADGERVSVRTRVGEVHALLEIDDGIMPGVVSLPHGWGHKKKGARMKVANATDGVSANDLTISKGVDVLTGTSILNGVPVEVGPLAQAAE